MRLRALKCSSRAGEDEVADRKHRDERHGLALIGPFPMIKADLQS